MQVDVVVVGVVGFTTHAVPLQYWPAGQPPAGIEGVVVIGIWHAVPSHVPPAEVHPLLIEAVSMIGVVLVTVGIWQ